ncbi:hypothetical protein ACA910_001432 [Epithemia clementina (nom. ined.)]
MDYDNSTSANRFMAQEDEQHEQVDPAGCTTTLVERATATTNVAKKPLPSFVRGQPGGLIIFFHVAKNGGTTIRRFLQGYNRVNVIWGPSTFIRNWALMRTIVEGRNNSTRARTTVVEIHMGPDTAVVELEKAIQTLRARALVNNIPFFVFSTVREPLSYAVSYYNYQNIGINPRYEHGTDSEEDFLRLSLPSPQCLFFARGELATTKDFPIFGRDLTQTECQEAYQSMTRTIDWIGTVDKIQNETLPLLAYLLEGKKRHVDTVQHNMANKEVRIELQNLTASAIAHIRNITQADLEIFQRVQQEYSLEMWTNFSNSRSSDNNRESQILETPLE